MPTYEYICDACQTEFEQFQSIKADPVKVCPSCKKRKVRRKISAGAGILFKGGGFYETDYRSSGYNESKKKDTDAAAPASASSDAAPAKTDGKSDSKTAAPAAPPATPAPAAPAKSESSKSSSDKRSGKSNDK